MIKHKKPSQSRKKATRTKGNPKDKVWSLKRADTEFRAYMIQTYDGVPICAFPGCQISDIKKLTVSHYFGRVKKGTRFVKDNCCFLCRNHHYWDKQRGWEFQKQTVAEHGWDGQYTINMVLKVGPKRLKELQVLAESGMKPKAAIKEFQASLTT